MKLKTTLYPYQEEGRDFAISRRYSICAFDMGLGKTLVALGLVSKLNLKRILVVCPAFLIPNWRAEIDKFTGESDRFTVISYGMLKKVARNFNYEAVVCDEFHFAKNLSAKRSQLLHDLIQTNRPEYLLGLSGTPIKNRIPEFYSLLKLVWYGGFYDEFNKYSKSYWAFNMRFCKQQQMNIGGRKITRWEGMKNIPELKELIAPIYNRKRDDGSIELPAQVFQDVLMDDKSVNDSLLEEAWDKYEGGKDRKSFSTAKAVNALAKVTFTAEFVTSKLEEAGGMIVFTDHVQAAETLAEQFKVETRVITGAVSKDLRHDYVTKLNNGKLKVLIATIGSLSMGINLTGINHMVFNDYPWSWADMSQALKRTHRIGQEKTCHYYYILSGRMDRRILRALEKKEKLMEAIDAKA